MSKYVYLVLSPLFLFSCTGAELNQEGTPIEEDPLSGFRYFPDTIFEGIYLGIPKEEARQVLISRGFELIDSSGSLYFERFADSSTCILVQHTPEIKEIKLVLKSSEIMKKQMDLEKLLRQEAARVESSSQFLVYDYLNGAKGTNVTLFIQKTSLHLHIRADHSH
jgi:hypothetical protein